MPDPDPRPSQTAKSVKSNSRYFLEHNSTYNQAITQLDTYKSINASVTEAVDGVNNLLDVGNGGVFDYDTSVVGAIIGVDLFLDKLPVGQQYPENVIMVPGDALNLPRPDASHDGVLMVMLLHHLIGRTWRDCVANLSQAVAEAARVLRPGGILIIVESCVPSWFFRVEKVLFRPSSAIINRFLDHPPAFQFTTAAISEVVARHFAVRPVVTQIPKGRFVLQYGLKVPSALTPVYPVRFVVKKT